MACDSAFLQWILDRLVFVHGEHKHADFIIRLNEIIDRNAWREIATAPRDGTEILLAGRAAPPSIDAGNPVIVKAYWTNHNAGGWVWHGAVMDFSHWRPLPDFPSKLPSAAKGNAS